MTYKFRRREARPFLTIGEFVADKHPELLSCGAKKYTTRS